MPNSPAFVRWLRRRFPRAQAMAFVGSRGRGDAGPGSDYDVWVIGGTRRRVHSLSFRGTPVTVFVEPWSLVQTPAHLARVERSSVAPLFDPRHRFARLKWSTSRRAVFVAARRETRQLLHWSTLMMPLPALACVRRAAMLTVAASVFRRHGILAPKWRQLERLLPRAALKTYRSIQGLQTLPSKLRIPRELAVARAKWSAGAREEAVLQVRDALWPELGLEHASSSPRWAAWRGSQLLNRTTPADAATLRERLAALRAQLP